MNTFNDLRFVFGERKPLQRRLSTA